MSQEQIQDRIAQSIAKRIRTEGSLWEKLGDILVIALGNREASLQEPIRPKIEKPKRASQGLALNLHLFLW